MHIFESKVSHLLSYPTLSSVFETLLGINANFPCSNLLQEISILKVSQKCQQNRSLVMLIAAMLINNNVY